MTARQDNDTLRDAAERFAKAFLDFAKNEVPAEWDGGDLGYSIGGLGAMADELLAVLAGRPEPAGDEVRSETTLEAVKFLKLILALNKKAFWGASPHRTRRMRASFNRWRTP